MYAAGLIIGQNEGKNVPFFGAVNAANTENLAVTGNGSFSRFANNTSRSGDKNKQANTKGQNETQMSIKSQRKSGGFFENYGNGTVYNKDLSMALDQLKPVTSSRE